jgi:UDP-N-acetylmuramoyl-tripeptide--D-alanyl-D-alanine ligase
MAMRGIGQIEELCTIARPQIGIVTNIGPVHLELLGSKENVARAKAELIAALPDRVGIAILNGDDPYTPLIREIACTDARELHVITFGLGSHNDIRADHVTYDESGHPSFDLWLPTGIPARVSLELRGEHSILNALAAAATGVALTIDAQLIVSALASVQAAPSRQAIQELEDRTLLIDDTYNANPDSIRVALEMLERLPDDRPHIVVLGDMRELGEDEEALHKGVGAIVAQTGVDVLVTIGSLACSYAEGARVAGMDEEAIISCSTVDEVLIALAPYRVKSPIILVKASRFMELERVTKGIISGIVPESLPADEETG